MPRLRLLPCYPCKLGLFPGQKKAVPAIDTVSAGTANWSCTVINSSLLFNARQDHETHNKRKYDMGSLAQFDESSIDWKPLPRPDGEAFEHVSLSILNVDENAKIVDILFKFSANEKIVMHRHCSNYSTFTVKGELRTYDPDGSLKSVRPAGVFKAGTPGECHTEGGGNEDVIVYFSLRPYTSTDPIYEVLNENLEVVGTMNFDALKELNEEYSK